MKILVVGDVIIDEYWHGALTKSDAEVRGGRNVRVVRSEDKLGGAAAVAYLLKSYGDNPLLASVMGDSDLDHHLAGFLQQSGVDVEIYRDFDRITTLKTRMLVGGRIQPDRYDFECTDDICRCHELVLGRINVDGVLALVDYGKGVLTRNLCSELIRRAQQRDMPVVVDPARGRCWSDYRGASLVKANKAEAIMEAAGELDETADLECLASFLARKHHFRVVVTDAENGMAWSDMEDSDHHAAVCLSAKEVEDKHHATDISPFDPTGCGDVVMATITSNVHSPLREACELANRRAAQNLYNLGVTTRAFADREIFRLW